MGDVGEYWREHREYKRAQRKVHKCYWPTCDEDVLGTRRWGCKTHWFTLPTALRSRFLDARTDAGRDAANVDIQAWIKGEYVPKSRGDDR